ncbi:unnamed protein product [Mycena citricolor]|uniref:Integral membrane protein n=1 Tax=Mycena citricolor TaxID=2018698 RepID=A0AAD2GY01_9AGAR|nr:unnamed protein product [Mycena citricolor]CAK5280228.1 unnamed protein product [Mycena citricolor]
MSEAARRPSELRPNVCRRLLGLLEGLGSIIPQNSSHPTQVAIRTYTLALCLSLTPALAPFLKRSKKHDLNELIRVLSREFGATGFAFSITVAIGGGSFIREFWRLLDGSEWDLSETQNPLSNSAAWIKERLKYMRVSSAQKTFISNILSTSAGLWLLQAGRARFRSTKGGSKTLDLTLLVFVRALDAAVQSFVARRSGSRRESDAGDTSFTRAPRDEAYTKRQLLRTRIDAFVFWACSARIMWCFFYAPQRLPKSYVKWINALANADTRLLDALRAIRTKDWLYRKGPPSPLLTTYARDLGYPASWGDPIQLPAFGHEADQAWRALGVTGRAGVAGIPCQLVHGTVGSSLGLSHSCTANAGLRGLVALMEAIVLYLPVSSERLF